MKLTVHEAAALLNTSEATVYRWIKDKHMPCQHVDDHYRFHRAELLEWATAHGVPVALHSFRTPLPVREAARPSFAAALRAGGVHYDVGGSDRDSMLREVVRRMPLPDETDRELVLEVMLAREALGSTGIGDGIAIPHVRSPVVVATDAPSVTLCFLRSPVAFGASDGRAVHTLFSIVSHTPRSHLHVLSRLSAALQDLDFRRAVVARAPQAEILAAATRVDAAHPPEPEAE